MNSKRKTVSPTLSDQEWRKVFFIVEKAGALGKEEQEDYIARATEGRPDLLRQVREFLSSSGPSSFLEEPIGPQAARHLLSEQLELGSEISDFTIKEELGRGAFATVYLAKQNSLGREVALKVTRFHQGDEARTIALMEHDHIIKVHSVTDVSEPPVQLICMQFVPSLDLERIMQHLPERTNQASALLEVVDKQAISAPLLDIRGMEERTEMMKLGFSQCVAALGVQLADALEYAHQKGVLHLDIKPANILLNHFGHAYITDFNISSTAENLKNSIPKNFGGTAHYMSPEQQGVFTADDKQAALSHIDRQSDIYSLGRVLGTLLEHAEDGVDRKSIQKVVDRACDPSKHNRYPTAAAFSKSLKTTLETTRTLAGLPETRGIEKWIEKHPIRALVGMGAIPQLIATAVAISYNSTQIVSQLSVIQQQTFESLNMVYNPLISVFALGIWLTQVWKLHLFLNHGEGEVDENRRHLLSLPSWGILVSTLGWVPGAVIFPVTLYVRGGELPAHLVGHLVLSFTFSYLIALSYTYFLHQWISLLQYRFFWAGSGVGTSQACEELSSIPSRLLGFCLATGLIPLMGASVVLFSGPLGLVGADDSFRLLVAALIGMGVAGVFFAMTLYQRLSRLIYLWGFRG